MNISGRKVVEQRFELTFDEMEPAGVEEVANIDSWSCKRAYPREQLLLSCVTMRKKKRFCLSHNVLITDISKGGIGVLCKHNRFTFDDTVVISIGSKKIVGKLVHGAHKKGTNEFRYGIRFEQELSISDMIYFGFKNIYLP